MNKITLSEFSPSEKTLNFIKAFARNYRAVKMPNGCCIDMMPG